MLLLLSALLAALATGAFILASAKPRLPKALGESLAGWRVRLGTLYLWRQRQREREAALRDWPGLLSQLSGALRAGESFDQACLSAQASAKGVWAGSLALLNAELRLGTERSVALDGLAQQPQLLPLRDSLRALSTTVQAQRESGGNLSELLDQLAEEAREREGFQAQVDALTAQGRLSALIVGALPVALFAGMTALDPGLTEPLWGRPLGWGLLFLAACLEAVGFWILRGISRIEL